MWMLLATTAVQSASAQVQEESRAPAVDSVRLPILRVEARYEPSAQALELDSNWRGVFADRPLSEALNAATAINIKSFGPGALSTAGYRGGAARHTAVRWNGLRLNSPLHGTVDLNLLPVQGLERVRLDAGASAAAQSGGTPGGLLDLQSGTGPGMVQQAPWRSAAHGLNATGSAGAFGQYQAGLEGWYGAAAQTAEGLAAESGWSGRSALQWTGARYDFPLVHPDWGNLGRMPDLGLERLMLQQDVKRRTNSGAHWHAAAAFSHVDRRLAPALFASDQQESERDRLGMASFQWNTKAIGATGNGPGRSWSAFGRAGWTADQVVYKNQLAGIHSVSEAHSLEGGGAFQWHPAPAWHFETQAFVRREHGRSGGLSDPGALSGESDTAVLRWEQRLRGSASWRPRPQWALRGDLMQDRYGGQWQPLVPAVHLQWRRSVGGSSRKPMQPRRGTDPKPWTLQMELGASRHYTRPSLNDLYWNPGGNPSLRSEKGWSADVEARLEAKRPSGRWNLVLQAWGQDISDWIQWAPGSEGFWSASNIGRVRGQGLEGRLLWAKDVEAAGQWTLQALYAWTRLRPEGGSVLLLQPEHRASGMLGFASKAYGAGHVGNRSSVPTTKPGVDAAPAKPCKGLGAGTWSWYLGLRGSAIGQRYASTDASQILPAFAALGLDGSIRYSASNWHFRWSVHLENANNTWIDAAQNRPMPGRWWRSSLILGWQGSH